MAIALRLLEKRLDVLRELRRKRSPIPPFGKQPGTFFRLEETISSILFFAVLIDED